MISPMISRALARALLGTSLCMTPPAGAADIAPTAATLPAMLVGCRALQVPVGDGNGAAVEGETSDAVFERERTAWMADVRNSPIKHVGPLYVVMDIPPMGHAGDSFPGEMCGRIDARASVSGMTVKSQAAKTGYAGFCASSDPEVCLEEIFAALGFSDTSPWPRMPLYALWRSEVEAPQREVDVINYLASTPFDVTEPDSEEGAGQEFQLNNISGCEGVDCPSFPEAVETTNGNGIGWFLELGEMEKPKPEGSTNGDDAEGAETGAP